MNLRCAYCQTPFTLGRNQILNALQTMHAEGLHHYDAHCPRCRKANQLPLERLERAAPNWREMLEAQKSAEDGDQPAE